MGFDVPRVYAVMISILERKHGCKVLGFEVKKVGESNVLQEEVHSSNAEITSKGQIECNAEEKSE